MKRFTFTPEARDDLRRIERRQAMMILTGLTRFGAAGVGDVKKLVDDDDERYRLRIGDWRVFFHFDRDDTIRVVGVENRKDAYR